MTTEEQNANGPGRPVLLEFRRAVALGTAMAAIIAVAGLLGFVLNMKILGSIRPDYIPMAPNSSVCFIVLSLVLFRHTRKPFEGFGLRAIKAVVLFVAVYGLLGFGEIFTGADLNFDDGARISPAIDTIGNFAVGQMSPLTAAVFAVAGLGFFLLLLRDRNSSHVRLLGHCASTLGVLTALSGATVLLAYLYGTPLMYDSVTIPMAATTAVAFICLGAALAAAIGPESFPLYLLAGDSTSVMLLRRFLPLPVTAVLLHSLLSRYIFDLLLVNEALLMAMMVVVIVIITAAVVAKIAGSIGNNLDEVNMKLRQTMEELRKSEERLRLAQDAAHSGTWEWNLLTNENIWSDELWNLYGLEPHSCEASYQTWKQTIHPDDQSKTEHAVQGAASKGSELNVEWRVCYPDGTQHWLMSRGKPLKDANGQVMRYLGIVVDITDRKRNEEEKLALEQQLLQVQKLESLGVLSGGIAHDFNNILAAILGHCGLLKLRPGKEEEHIPEIEKAVERAAELCRQMLAYAGKAQSVITQVDMTVLINEMVRMLQATIPQNAVIRPELSVNVPLIKGDPCQLGQIVMNLILNASEAIGQAQGEIRVSLSKSVFRRESSEKDHLGRLIMPGVYVCLEVADNGCGMDDETMKRLFEPFYTTKFTGRGLGMSATLGIITAHKGALQLFSRPGQGTTFRIYLPVQI